MSNYYYHAVGRTEYLIVILLVASIAVIVVLDPEWAKPFTKFLKSAVAP